MGCHDLSACWLWVGPYLMCLMCLFNVFNIRLALDSSNWIKICLDSSSRILESCFLMYPWLFCWWLWTSLCLVSQVCRKIIFCSFGMFKLLVRSTLFYSIFEYCLLSYLGIHSDCAWSIWASPAIFKQFRPIYVSSSLRKLVKAKKSERHSWSFVWKLISKPGCVLVVFICANKNKQFI